MSRAAWAELPPHLEARVIGGASVRVAGKPAGKWGKAKPCIVDSIRFRSQTEARVYLRLKSELPPGDKLVIDCRFPLVALAPRIGKASKAGYITIDFCRYTPHRGEWVLVEAVDAKPPDHEARSRDWSRGARAFLATYGIEIHCTDR